MNENILEIFRKSADAKGIPNLPPNEWKELNSKYDKETIIASLIDYVHIYKPEPPLHSITEADMVHCFHKLRKVSYEKFLLSFTDTKDRVLEKYDDYGHKYKDCGLGVVQMGTSYLDVSNYYNQKLRMNCSSYGFKSPHYRWTHAEDLRTVFLALWRLGNDRLNEKTIIGAFRLSTYIATQFKPHVAKVIYDMTEAKIILDTSCGWGDRLAGFYCSNAEEYYGCDPNPETFRMYINQCWKYERLLGTESPKFGLERTCGEPISFVCIGKKKVVIHRTPAEDFDYKTLPPIDCAFTSPPYFSTELYNHGGDHESDQSWARYKTYEEWEKNFFLPVNEQTFESLSDGGIQITNIQDPKIHNTRHRSSDSLIADLITKYPDCRFLGQLGMRIMQRPRNIEKKQLLDLFNKLYIEPCWVFGKNRTSFRTEEVLSNYME